ncbi:hypothetical protein MesoLj131b_71140 (plasmid) [Mesorhizobium sp. 131-2-5]|nr:hypothetical protein MesoLj131b_71140 [Mesorhizobium sp. 131-2-5]
MRGLQAKAQRPFWRPIEADPKVCQGFNRVRGRMEDTAGDVCVAQAIAGGNRVGEVQRRIIVMTHARGQTALCPRARCFRSEWRPGQNKHGFWRQMKRGQ